MYLPTNPYSILDFEMPETEMEVETNDDTLAFTLNPSPSRGATQPAWNNDTGVSELSDEIFTQLLEKQTQAMVIGDLDEDATFYEKPEKVMNTPKQISQQIRFNLIRHHGTVSDIPAILQCRPISNYPPLSRIKTT